MGARVMFQSTPPRGGRLDLLIRWNVQYLFQSTPPRGGRLSVYREGSTDQIVSIHAPAWGATGRLPLTSCGLEGFNPRPRVGGDVPRCPGEVLRRRFNPRPRVGGDLVCRLAPSSAVSFQSTPPRGGRRRWRQCVHRSAGCFNPRPRVGGDSLYIVRAVPIR